MNENESFEETMKRLANHIETKLAEIIPQLLAESNSTGASSLLGHGQYLIRDLRALAGVKA